jgi:hypothetical protein
MMRLFGDGRVTARTLVDALKKMQEVQVQDLI